MEFATDQMLSLTIYEIRLIILPLKKNTNQDLGNGIIHCVGRDRKGTQTLHTYRNESLILTIEMQANIRNSPH